ncbi:MAG: cobalamin-dependent protein [Acidobacteriota bacterium]|nr:cobalamin-dependent protein [Acidobacteriota bacterium]MCY3966375.1 cobalamin-dependent protein [Acidobacteriota bacterium]MDE2851250.1 cobalamin-dependent protein [Acidobacteriota bacterium]MDE2921553.1 cobalamin-dependent protein [Acidobacteriota bacterium]MDE3266468.1 cobalamin-dependent protein [Acidobacteriota bacterium]
MSPIRVLVGVLGMDQHELGAVGIARMLRDQGMEVIYTGCFNTPETIVQAAMQEDADVIGISSHSWEYLYYTPELLELLKQNDLDVPVVLGGSVITEEDAGKMLDKGVAAVFGSGSAMTDMIDTVRNLAAGAATS